MSKDVDPMVAYEQNLVRLHDRSVHLVPSSGLPVNPWEGEIDSLAHEMLARQGGVFTLAVGLFEKYGLVIQDMSERVMLDAHIISATDGQQPPELLMLTATNRNAVDVLGRFGLTKVIGYRVRGSEQNVVPLGVHSGLSFTANSIVSWRAMAAADRIKPSPVIYGRPQQRFVLTEEQDRAARRMLIQK